ncbi:sugar ABC transporter permease [Devosia geojensis]|uniref:Transport permease protein n=2 Tax=Devosia geojensis TaxID=443610 RepID=A0A0F5FE03_9HYPH|nr:sugar ABC transporter permease [Devosia geojensis]
MPYMPGSLVAMLLSPWRDGPLLWELVKRDFLGRYKGSFAGVAWSLVNPLLMLAIYTFVFSVAFRARWGVAEESQVDFAIILFSGLIVHSLFAECLNRAPSLITSHPNYVKKVVFPLEILPWMALGSALGHFLISFCVLVLFCLVTGTTIHAGALLLPVVLLPLLLMILGLSWLLASLGVFLRDIAQVIGMVTMIALFLAPIFYPIDALPVPYQALLAWNPVTLPVMNLRAVMLWGQPVDWLAWSASLVIGAAIFGLGLAWFQKTRKGFADVL